MIKELGSEAFWDCFDYSTNGLHEYVDLEDSKYEGMSIVQIYWKFSDCTTDVWEFDAMVFEGLTMAQIRELAGDPSSLMAHLDSFDMSKVRTVIRRQGKADWFDVITPDHLSRFQGTSTISEYSTKLEYKWDSHFQHQAIIIDYEQIQGKKFSYE